MHKNFVVCKNNIIWYTCCGMCWEVWIQRQPTWRTDSLPLAPLSEYQRTDYMKDGQAFPWHPSRSTRGQTTSTTDKPSPGAPLGAPEDRLHEGQTSLPLVYPSRDARGQTTCRTDEASPWCTLLGMPEDRLHVGQTKPPPGVPFSGCQRTDYM